MHQEIRELVLTPPPSVLAPPPALGYAPLALSVLDAEGGVAWASASFRAWLGEDEGPGGWTGPLCPALRAEARVLVEERHPIEGTEGTLRVRGRAARVLFSGTPLPDEAGVPGGSVVAFTPQPEGGADGPDLATLDAAAARLHNAALGQHGPLALIEAATRVLAETFKAGAAFALVRVPGAPGEDALVRCAAWPPGAPALAELEGAAFSAHAPTRLRVAEAGTLAEAVGAGHALAVPFGAEEHGLFLLVREGAFSGPDEAAAARLVGQCQMLLAWARAEGRLQRTVADLEDALFTYGLGPGGGRAYAFVTPQALAITGLAPDALLGGEADWAALVLPEDRARFEAHEAALRMGEPSRVEVRIRRPCGTVGWISERASPGVDTAGRPTAGGLLADVTARKEAEATLLQARRVAERAAQARMGFLRVMSHELRTPLGTIRGFAEMLAEEVAALPDPPDVALEFAAAIEEGARRALALVSNLLDLSRLETGSLQLHLTPTDVGALAQAAGARYAATLEARGVGYRFEGAAEAALVLADPARVEQVVAEMLEATGREAREVTLQVGVGGGEVVVRVEGGPEVDDAEALFEPFSQAEGGPHAPTAGLGLPIARRLAEAMGGTVRVGERAGSLVLVLPR